MTPLLYHGTRKEFDKFRPLSHFGDVTAANVRLGYIEQPRYKGPIRPLRKSGAHIRRAYLDIRNPARIEDDKAVHHASPLSYFKAVYDAGHISKAEFLRETIKPTLERFIKMMEAQGYDGLVYKNRTEGDADSFVIFNSTQVKEKKS